ncbi:MAG: aldehyde ferredoxin oxidoreductase family protein [Candidatus Hodarchaeota archaeon]
MEGFCKKLLRVDLTKNSILVEEIKQKLMMDYLGGRGLGVKYFLDEVDPKVDPLSPNNVLIFATGPATGTPSLGGNSYEVVTKSPLTGGITGSRSAGFWGPELKFAGYDMIIIEGRAKEPVYLWIVDGRAELRPAINMWGKNTYETQELIKKETQRRAKVACVGPAGENLVRFACIINDEGRAAGRGGTGAVMGSKNLKGIAVRGTKKIIVADESYLREIVKKAWAGVKKPQMLSKFGTAYVVIFVNEVGVFPTHNFQTGVFEGAQKISGEAVNNNILIKRKACYSCPMGCAPITKVAENDFIGEGAGPEYEGLYSLGSCCGVDNLNAIVKAFYTCNELGIDVMSTGATIACAMEMVEKGFLPDKDVGMKLNFGNAKALCDLVTKTAYREGFGNTLAEGSYRLADRYGHPEFSMSVKKQELAGYDPRGAQGMGLAYATSTRGADHMRSQFEDIDVFGMLIPELGITEPTDRFATAGKASLLIKLENDKAAIDSMGICAFLSGYKIGFKNLLHELEAITGFRYDLDDWLKVGERIYDSERLLNLGSGFTKRDDSLPKRFLEEPMQEGPSKGHVVKLSEMLPEYYRLRGWDGEGNLTEFKLRELGVTAINHLRKH